MMMQENDFGFATDLLFADFKFIKKIENYSFVLIYRCYDLKMALTL